MDFTHTIYESLLQTLQSVYNSSITFKDFILQSSSSLITSHSSLFILRHDVDRIPKNALKLAQIESSLNIKGTYYFRVVPQSYDLKIMNTIASLGHEIGYHYEDVDLVLTRNSELRTQNSELIIESAYESFCKNLEMLRKNYYIQTICMHGSPLSKFDNRMIWQKYNYRDLGIIGEPYYDIDFNVFAYFTDTGRRWNGNKINVRDRVNSKYNFNFKTTQQIIDNIDKLPSKIMFTTHPERWHDSFLPWSKELVWQNVKNVGKRIIVSSNE